MVRTWRVINHLEGDAFWNMAIDEAILSSFRAGQCPPTIRFYSWDKAAVSLGRFQKIERSIDRVFCRRRGIPIVRRPTGGRAVLHGTDLTFSAVNRDECTSVVESYERLSRAVTDALLAIGVPVEPFANGSDRSEMRSVANCFDLQAGFEVALAGRKVFGCAQLRADGCILQQNSLILRVPASDNGNAFVGGCPDKSCACIAQYADAGVVMASIRSSIEQAFDVLLRDSDITEKEHQFAEHLLQSKYSNDDWNLRGRLESVVYRANRR